MYRTYEGSAQVNVYNADGTIPVAHTEYMLDQSGNRYEGRNYRHHDMQGDGCCNECDSSEYYSNPHQTSVPDNKAHHGW